MLPPRLAPALAIVLLAATAGCIPFASVVDTPRLEGVVVAGDDGLPVSHAQVVVPEFDLSTTTDADGRFAFEEQTSRKLFVMILPGSTIRTFPVQAWHGDGAIGEGHTWINSIGSSFGLTSSDILVVLVNTEAPLHPELEACGGELSLEVDYAARLALRMEDLLEVEAFRAVYDGPRAFSFEESLRHDLYRVERECDGVEDGVDRLLDASSDRQYGGER